MCITYLLFYLFPSPQSFVSHDVFGDRGGLDVALTWPEVSSMAFWALRCHSTWMSLAPSSFPCGLEVGVGRGRSSKGISKGIQLSKK